MSRSGTTASRKVSPMPSSGAPRPTVRRSITLRCDPENTRLAWRTSSATALNAPPTPFVSDLRYLLELVEDERRPVASRRLLQEAGGVVEDFCPPGGTHRRVEAEAHTTVGPHLHRGRYPQAAQHLLEVLTGPTGGPQHLPHDRIEHRRRHLVRGGAQQQVGVAAPPALAAEPPQRLQQQRRLAVAAGREHEGVHTRPHPARQRRQLVSAVAEALPLHRGAVPERVRRFHRSL